MSHPNSLARAGAALVLAVGLLAACADDPTAPVRESLRFNSLDNGNGVIVEVGEHRAPFGVLRFDPENQVALYYRWDNGFCGGVVPTQFVNSTFHDVIRIDESWRTLDKTDGFWFYVYPYNGTTPLNCAYLRNTTPLATGRGHRLFNDNDFFPFGPYGPGPGANAHLEMYRATLTTPAGETVQFRGDVRIIVAPDGQTLRVADVVLQLSPDPR